MPEIPDRCRRSEVSGRSSEEDNLSVRLAYHPEGDRTLKEIGPVRRPALNKQPEVFPNEGDSSGLSLSSQKPLSLRLAHVPGAQGDNVLKGQRGVEQLEEGNRPALLVSYIYVEEFLRNQTSYGYRDWMMDSGAYSAYNSGKVIDLQEYTDFCHALLAEDPSLVEIIALDVIGDGRGSLANAFQMKEAGLEVIPVFHVGEDWGILKEYCQAFQKVGLSCRFGEPLKKSYWFYDQCFARHWPKPFHSFGWMGEKMLMRYPFHSADSTSWEVGPCQYGNWKSFRGVGKRCSVRGSQQNLRAEVAWWLEFERKLREKWKREMAKLQYCPRQSASPLSTRLAVEPNSRGGRRAAEALNKESQDAPEAQDLPANKLARSAPVIRLARGCEGTKRPYPIRK